jgi:hypothetical protein
MRTYDPADGIRYVHLAQDPSATAAAPDGACHPLPAGYANRSRQTCLAGPAGSPSRGAAEAVDTRPALVVIPGGAGTDSTPSPAAPVLRLA